MAGLNYFLTHEARGGSAKKLLGEKRDVQGLARMAGATAHDEVDAIETPIGCIPHI